MKKAGTGLDCHFFPRGVTAVMTGNARKISDFGKVFGRDALPTSQNLRRDQAI
jgi:hypothetical protein